MNAFDASNRLVFGIAAKRVTYLINGESVVVRIWDRINPLTHSRDVLDAAQSLAAVGQA